MRYLCTCCGEEHDEWPAITFPSPLNYDQLSEKEKKSIAELDSEHCIIKYEDQIDRFIRVILKQKVNGSNQDLQYGFWVSLNEENFNDYKLTIKNKNAKSQYFGWLCSSIPQYEEMLTIPTTVIINQNNLRPEIFPHEDFVHPFVYDYYNGIEIREAEKRIHEVLDFISVRNKLKDTNKKQWWKIW